MNAITRTQPEIPSQLQFELIDQAGSFAALKPRWDALALRSEFPTPFQLFGYSQACWKAYQDSLDLRIILGTALGEVRSIAPFVQLKSQPGHWAPLGETAADYLDLLVARDDRTAQHNFRQWVYQNRLWTKIQWHDVIETSSLLSFPATNALKKPGAWPRLKRVFQQKFPLTISGGPSEHCFMTAQDLENKRDILNHRSHTKHANWLSRQGKLEYTQLRDPAEIGRALPTFFEMHRRKWSSKAGQSFYSDPRVVRFTECLLQEMAEYRCLRMDLLRLSGRPIAAHFGFQFRGRLFWYITAYEPDYHSHSPGKLLLAQVIANAQKDGVTEIDFLRGDESYKSHYGSGRRKVWGIRQYRSRAAYLYDAVKCHFFSR